MQENADQSNSEYGHFSRSASTCINQSYPTSVQQTLYVLYVRMPTYDGTPELFQSSNIIVWL